MKNKYEMLLSLPNDLRTMVKTVEKFIDVANDAKESGEITPEQLNTFTELLKRVLNDTR